MKIKIRAFYDGQVIRPLEPVNLPPGTHVLLTIETLDPNQNATVRMTRAELFSRYLKGERDFVDIVFDDSTDLSSANLSGTKFFNCSLLYADFTNANLQNVKFFSCSLKGANFTAADLRGAVLFNSSIDGIVLAQAQTENASFKHTHAYGGTWEQVEPPT